MVAEHGLPRDVARDMAGVVKTIPRECIQRRAVVRRVDVLLPQFQEQTDEVVGVMSQERASGRVWEEIAEVPGLKAVSVEEVFVPQVMKENVEVTRWIPQGRGVVSMENEVTGARLASLRHARKRQRKIASRLRVRFGDEEQSVVGMSGCGLGAPWNAGRFGCGPGVPASKRIWLARVAAEAKHDEKKSMAAATTNEQDETMSVAAVKKWDEETNTAAAKQCDELTTTNEEANMNTVGHVEMQGAINLLSFQTDAAAMATEKRMNFGGSLEVTMRPESSQRRVIIETRPVRELNTLMGEMVETTDGDQTGGWVERERRGDWDHLYGPVCCSVCGQNPFECGCLNVSFESRWEKKRREEREREMVDHLKELREEMAEMSLQIEKLERGVLWERSGYSSGSSGNEWAWWNGAWWIKTKSRMNSASKRKVSKAVKQAMNKDDEKLKADLSRMMVYLKHERRSENMSDTDREMTRRRKSIEEANRLHVVSGCNSCPLSGRRD